MRDSSSLHQKVQEMCDCFAASDPLKEMSRIGSETEAEEAAVKWIAMAVLHGINSNAEEISIEQSANGTVKVIAEYRKAELPPVPGNVGDAIIRGIKDIIHADSSQSDSVLAFGFRNNSMELRVKVREESGNRKATLYFP